MKNGEQKHWYSQKSWWIAEFLEIDTARKDGFTGDTPGNEWVYGKLDSRASIEFVNCSGQITSVAIKYDVLAEQQKKRFNFVTLLFLIANPIFNPSSFIFSILCHHQGAFHKISPGSNVISYLGKCFNILG